jgi:hypothetical protein
LRNYAGSNSWYIGLVEGLARRPATAGIEGLANSSYSVDTGASSTLQQQAVAPGLQTRTDDTGTDTRETTSVLSVNLKPSASSPLGVASRRDDAASQTSVETASPLACVQSQPLATATWLLGQEASERPSQRLSQQLQPQLKTLGIQALLRPAI